MEAAQQYVGGELQTNALKGDGQVQFLDRPETRAVRPPRVAAPPGRPIGQ